MNQLHVVPYRNKLQIKNNTLVTSVINDLYTLTSSSATHLWKWLLNYSHRLQNVQMYLVPWSTKNMTFLYCAWLFTFMLFILIQRLKMH